MDLITSSREPNGRLDLPSTLVPEVEEAVLAARISRSHATLLGLLRPHVQRQAIEELLLMNLLPGVGELKSSIESLAVDLSLVSFVKDDCETCQYNTDNQSAQADVKLAKGLCLNGSCATEKHDAVLEEKRIALLRQYRAVQMPAEMQRFIVIDEHAEADLGAHTVSDCRAECQRYGAAITNKGPQFPVKVVTQVCTSSACYAAKAELHRSEKLVHYRNTVWRRALAAHVNGLQHVDFMRAMIAILALGWKCNPAHPEKVLGVDEDHDLASFMRKLDELDAKQASAAIRKALALMIEEAPEHQVTTLLRHFGVQLSTLWIMPKTLLGNMSMVQLTELIEDLKVDLTEPAQHAIRTGDRAGLVSYLTEALTKTQLTGYVPRLLRY